MTADHVDGLTLVGLDPELWRWIPDQVTTRDEMRRYVTKALDELQRGASLPSAALPTPRRSCSSILDSEWPALKARLSAFLDSRS